MIPFLISTVLASSKAIIGTAISFLTVKAPLLVKSGVAILSKNAINLINFGKFIPKSANIITTKKINKELFNLATKYADDSKPFEDLAKNILGNYSDTIKLTLDKFSSEYKLPDFLINNLEYKTKSFKNNISDLYEKEISKTFSLNNKSLLNILEEHTSLEKEKMLRNFTLEYVEKTHEKFIEEFKTYSKNQQDLITEELINLDKNKSKELENLQNELELINKCYKNEVEISNKINNLNNILYKLQKI